MMMMMMMIKMTMMIMMMMMMMMMMMNMMMMMMMQTTEKATSLSNKPSNRILNEKKFTIKKNVTKPSNRTFHIALHFFYI